MLHKKKKIFFNAVFAEIDYNNKRFLANAEN